MGRVVQPGQVRIDQSARACRGGHSQRLGAGDVRLELRADRAHGGPAGGLNGVGMFKHLTGHLGGSFQGALKGLLASGPHRPNDVGKKVRIELN